MPDALGGSTGGPDLESTDYLGTKVPTSFKAQPALPTGRPASIGASAPGTIGGGGVAAPKGPTPKQSQEFDTMLRQLFSGGDGGTGGVGDTGGPSPEGISGIHGFDANLVGMALSMLGAVPGSQFGLPSTAFSLAKDLGAMPNANLTDTQGNPVSYTGPNGLMSLIGSLFSGKGPQFTAVGPNGELSSITTDRSGETGALGLGAQAAFDAAAQGRSPYGESPTQGPVPSFQGRTGIGVDEGTPGAQGPPGFSGVPGLGPPGTDDGGMGGVGSGGGSGSGDSVICTLLTERGLIDYATLRANGVFRRDKMDAATFRGYQAWAGPLVRLCRRSPLAFRVLYALLGWAPRAYMAEIARPGSSKTGRVILRLALPVCRWLGRA